MSFAAGRREPCTGNVAHDLLANERSGRGPPRNLVFEIFSVGHCRLLGAGTTTMTSPRSLFEREEPLRRLESAFAATRKGAGRIVSLEGEAGIGKTALTLAFMDARGPGVRIYLGGCEHLTTPEPLGPLRDIARASQGRFSISTVGQLATFEALLRLLTGGEGPALLVLEDIHWADEATLDALRFLGRRIRTARVMVLVTFRNDEPSSQAQLAAFWADMPRDARERIELERLSPGAVARLAIRLGRPPGDIFASTGGNPFHVMEHLAHDGEGVPQSIQELTLARAARLSARARRALECASIFPRRIDDAIVRALANDEDDDGIAECLAGQMLTARDGVLAFRHELARRAINEALPPLRRRDLHRAALDLLKMRQDASAAEVAHHAEIAGDVAALTEFSVRAAQDAMRLGAYREAVAHLSRAIEHGECLMEDKRAQLLERKAFAAHFCGDFQAAVAALDRAIEIYRTTNDVLGLGNVLRLAGHVHWNLGDPVLADELLEEAVRVLSSIPESWQYAMALASQAQFDMLADRNAKAIPAAEDALARARKLGRKDIYLQAITYLGAAHASTNLASGVAELRHAIQEARALDELDALPRIYTILTSVTAAARRHADLLDTMSDGAAICVTRDQAPLEANIRGNRATAYLDMGRLRDALDEAEQVVHGPHAKSATALPAMVALSRARVRLGLPEGGVLDQARQFPTAQRDLLRRVPIAIADAEAFWLNGERVGAGDRLAEVHDGIVAVWSQLWNIGETALWLAILGRPPKLGSKALAEMPDAHRAHVEGRWRDAAQLWSDWGCPYEQAIALSGGDEGAQREALAIFDRLGAAPAARNLRRHMRTNGIRSVPAGPRSARKSDPDGLTRRQRDVFALLGEGLGNSKIADRLGLSPKTVEHHVGAILSALEAPNRLAAVQIARSRKTPPKS